MTEPDDPQIAALEHLVDARAAAAADLGTRFWLRLVENVIDRCGDEPIAAALAFDALGLLAGPTVWGDDNPPEGAVAHRSNHSLIAIGAWSDQGACKRLPDPDDAKLFWSPDGYERHTDRRAREAKAKAICEPCPVKAECLEHALTTPELHGVWGGQSEDERAGVERRLPGRPKAEGTGKRRRHRRRPTTTPDRTKEKTWKR